ncbi:MULTISPECIES: hypothetical protein [Streptomyces]|uniref:Uncharacterized protein n=1 Tax=Streptomyces griseosporeus TaxID=1910 RepID=A0ABV3KL80_STRGS|nr:hypothetical protein [Streptomyces actuosus]MBM4822108.1 hypothetical protein [Streptomyces actuosus]
MAREFFSEDRAGTPVLFFLDEPELVALRGGEDVEQLGPAVSSVLSWHDNPYAPVSERYRAWKWGKREDPPPCLPLLGSAVLAAANMRRTVQGPGAPAYYARLAEVLHPPWGGEQHGQRLERHYEAVADLWVELDGWLREKGGTRGLSTIKRNPARSKIGYAQSQALVRASDHAALTRFFQTTGVTPNQAVDGARLLGDLAAWSHRHPQGLSKELRQALDSDGDKRLLEPLLVALVEGWDGNVSPGFVDGLRVVPLRLVLEDGFTGWDVRWHAEVVPGVPADVLRYPGGEMRITSEPGDQTYEVTGSVPDPANVINSGITAKGTKVALRVQGGRELLVLREDPVAGGWTETDVLTVFEPYRFLFRSSGQQQLQALVTGAGERWYQPEEAPISGWQVTPVLEFSDETGLTQALAKAGFQNVRYSGARRLSLRNGLRVRPGWGLRSHFLLGAEPDVMVPAGLCRQGFISLDGRPLSVPSGGLVPLRGRNLSPGPHVLAADGAELTFYLEELNAPAPRPASPAAPAQRASATVVVPLSGDARFLTAQGRFLHIARPQEPSWWRQCAPGLCGGGKARVPVPAAAVWLVVVPAQGALSVTLLQHAEPDIGILSRAAKDFWVQIMLDDQAGSPHADLWQRYREAVLTRNSQGGFRRV